MSLLLLFHLFVASAPAATPEELQRTQGVKLLTALSEAATDHELKRLWMAVAASTDPADLALVKWALRNRAVLAVSPADARVLYLAELESERKAQTERKAESERTAAAETAASATLAVPAAVAEAAPAAPPAAVAEAPAASTAPAVVAPQTASSPVPPEPTRLPRIVGGMPYATSGEMAETTLASGMRVVVIGDPALGVTAIVHQVRVGSGHEVPGTEGLAHLVEHLMFEGQTDVGSWMDAAELLGGYSNASTSHDVTRYTTSVAPDVVQEAIHLEATRFLSPLATERIDAERAIIEDELRMRGGLEPGARMYGRLTEQLMGRHKYARPVGGSPETLAGLTPEVAAEFAARAYGGANIDLVIVGPHAVASVITLVQREYEGQRSGIAFPSIAAVDDLASDVARIRVAGLRSRYAGKAWHLPATGPCSAGTGEDQAACRQAYWTRQVMLGLLQSEGADVLSEALANETSLPTPIDVGTWEGQAGGYVLVMAPLHPEGLVALNNLGVSVLGLIKGVLWIPTFGLTAHWRLPPWRTNPTPAMVRRVLANSDVDWVDEAAIARVQEDVLIDALSRTWYAEDRAFIVADRLLNGIPADVGPREALAAVTPTDVRADYTAIIQRRQGARVHVD